MEIERLTATEQVMVWADRVWPQDIAALAILERAPSLDAVAASVAGRVQLVPRFRQLLKMPASELGAPYWVDDPAFDVSRHIHTLALPAPGDEPALLATAAELMGRRLDPAQPLWEMWFLTGMPGGRAAMFVRTHHAIADGIAGIATLAALLDLDAESSPDPPEPWAPAAPPGEAELRVDYRRNRALARRRRLARLAHPIAALRGAMSAIPAVGELVAERQIPATSLDRRVGAGRALALVRADLDVVKGVAHARGAKVNDVLLTVISGGLRGVLRSHCEAPPQVMRIYVPISLRHGQYAGARGNQIAEMVVPLPVAVDDPVARLDLIAAETARRKARVRPSIEGLPTRGVAAKLMLWLIDRQHVNVESADLPGPPVPLYVAGARILEMFPLLPLIGRVTLGVGGLSYAGGFYIAAVADAGSRLDLAAFTDGVRATLDALAAAVDSRAAA